MAVVHAPEAVPGVVDPAYEDPPVAQAPAEPESPVPPPVAPAPLPTEPEPPAPPPAPEQPPVPPPVPTTLPPRSAPPVGSAQPLAPEHARRTWLTRLAALAALAAVVVAVIALAHSLGSKHTATVTTPTVVRVLVPEGKTRAQIAQIASAEGLKGSYRVASRRSPLLDPTHYGAPRDTPDLEGFLFPATYDMDSGARVQRLVDEQLIAFRENVGTRYFARARALHVTPYQLLIVASMVEREAQVSGDRAKIAAVIYNRLREGMPLGIDATIYYAVEQEKGIPTYTHELTEAQLHIDSPYNSRTHTGLPPTPISNPGLASIRAAAHPAHVSYLYYVAAPDGCGKQVFSDTLAQFESDSAAYRAAVERNGGHPPACKHK